MEVYKKPSKNTICIELSEDKAKEVLGYLAYMDENGLVFGETSTMELLVALNRILRIL